MTAAFTGSISDRLGLRTNSADRVDYIYHPESGEKMAGMSQIALKRLRSSWGAVPDIQIIISDGLNPRAMMDEGHIDRLFPLLKQELEAAGQMRLL